MKYVKCLWRRWSNGRVWRMSCDVGEAPMTYVKQRKGCRMRCGVGKAVEVLENELWRRPSLILQPLHRFTYVTAHSPTLPPLYLRHSSMYSPYVVSPTSPGEPHMPLWWCLVYPWWFCNLQWLRPAGLYERCKLALELKRLKTPDLQCGLSRHSMACNLL